jgi:multidrug efflux pump subunit AcrA (membrane-fusion protein)
MKHRILKALTLGLTSLTGAWLLFGVHHLAGGAEPDRSKLLTLECRGSVKPHRELTLRLRPNERVLAVHVTAGEVVKAGDPLAEIFDGEAWMRLQDLKRTRLDSLLSRSELRSKVDRLDHVEAELKTQLNLWKEVEPASAERRVLLLRDKRDELQEQVALLRLRVADSTNLVYANGSVAASVDEQINKLEAQLASPVIVAPFNGRVAFLGSDPTRSTAGETVLEFWDTNIVVRAEVLQHQLPLVSKGCRAEVSLDFSDSKPVAAIVDAVEMRAETQPGETYPTYGVRLALDSTADRLRPGMRVSVRIHSEGRTVPPAS